MIFYWNFGEYHFVEFGILNRLSPVDDKSEQGENDVKSSCPYALGDTRATMVRIKGRDPAVFG